MSDIIDEALAEAYASAREGVRWYDTIELYHDDWASPLRVVNDTADFTGVLEAEAPRNPGEAVTFSAFSFKAIPPQRGDQGRQELPIQIDGVSREAFNLLLSSDAANGATQVISRVFVNTNTSGPSRRHVLTVKSISVNEKNVTLNCLFADFVNRRFPSKIYDQTNYPGLFR